MTTEAADDDANMFNVEDFSFLKSLVGHSFSTSRESCVISADSPKSILTTFKTWLQAHEEAQVMLASLLVVFALWWLVRTVVAFLINLVCPILIVLFAVICIPQLRAPLFGQNYPLVANLIRDILLKMADNMKT